MYPVTLSFGGSHNVTHSIGFRTFELVTNPNATGFPTTMLFRVNGDPIWARGANMIPLDEMEGRYSVDRYLRIVDSAMRANMNVFRIWGGGIFFHRIFYQLLDLAGIVAYHDMMYAQQGHSPLNGSATQRSEIEYSVLRLASHPSIVVWDSCNECGGYGVYQDFVATTVASVDQSRAIWPSCPSMGWSSGVDSYGRPTNGSKLVTRPTLTEGIETHGPYQHGTGFKTVNDLAGRMVLFPSNVPPSLSLNASIVGPDLPGVFASEFGASVMSSFGAMNAQLTASHRNFHDAPIFYQRNYPCDNFMQVYFGTSDVGTLPFRRQGKGPFSF